MEVLACLLSVLEAEAYKFLLFSYSTTLLDILENYIYLPKGTDFVGWTALPELRFDSN